MCTRIKYVYSDKIIHIWKNNVHGDTIIYIGTKLHSDKIIYNRTK